MGIGLWIRYTDHRVALRSRNLDSHVSTSTM
jgi:hypothetical protein